MNILNLDYYYGIEAEQFSFYRIPRLLIKGEQFKSLSSDSKLLYGLMLDRMALSMKNGWLDEENRVYIHYTLDEIMEDLGCAKEKAAKVLAELDSKKGIGLIEKKRQGLGKPDIIYVKNFATFAVGDDDGESENPPEIPSESPANTDISTEVRKSNFKRFENRTSRSSEIELQEVRKSNSNYTNNNYTNNSYNNNIYPSIYPSSSIQEDGRMDHGKMDKRAEKYRMYLWKNLECDIYGQEDEPDSEMYLELYEIICDIVSIPRDVIRIEGMDVPYDVVKSCFVKLNPFHLKYVIENIKNQSTRIKNIKNYAITALYNAPKTIDMSFMNRVNADMQDFGMAGAGGG